MMRVVGIESINPQSSRSSHRMVPKVPVPITVLVDVNKMSSWSGQSWVPRKSTVTRRLLRIHGSFSRVVVLTFPDPSKVVGANYWDRGEGR